MIVCAPCWAADPQRDPGACLDDTDEEEADDRRPTWVSGPLTRDKPDTRPDEVQRQRVASARGVGGRPLVQPQRGESAFVTNHFGFRQGVAYVEIPGVPVPQVEKRVNLQLAGLVERFDLGVRFSERFGLFAGVDGQIVTSLNAETALVTGARTGYGWEFGSRHSLWRDLQRRMAVGLTLRLTGADRAQLSPSRLLDALRDEPDQTLEAVVDGKLFRYLIVRQAYTSVGAALAGAWDLGQGLSLQSSLDLRLGETQYTYFNGRRDEVFETNRVNLASAHAVTWDAGTIYFQIPAAVQIFYRVNRLQEEVVEELNLSTAGWQHRLGLAGFYTGRSDLLLGVQVSSQVLTDDAVAQTTLYTQLTMRYFF